MVLAILGITRRCVGVSAGFDPAPWVAVRRKRTSSDPVVAIPKQALLGMPMADRIRNVSVSGEAPPSVEEALQRDAIGYGA